MADEILPWSSDEGSSVDWPSVSSGSPVDRDEFVEEDRSPILFKLLDEGRDDVETVDSPRGKSGVFGASLSTWSRKDGCFCHRLHKDDEAKWAKFRPRKGDDVQDGDELQYINHVNVLGWSHQEVMETIRHLKNKITFTFFREKKDFEEGHILQTDDLFIEITFTLSDLGSDGKGISIGDVASHVKDVTIKIIQNITYKSTLTFVQYCGTKQVKIGHGALTQHFLRATNENVTMEPQTSDQEAYCFLMHSYSVQDAAGRDPEQLKCMVAFQSCLNKKFLMCRKGSNKLSLLQTDIDDHPKAGETVKVANSPCLFLMTVSSSDDIYLESVAYEGYFLGFDKVDLLELTHLPVPPTSPDFQESACIRRNYTFHIY
ncbi:uncharacterized protein [Haliotis asinina]|uniref:uncharacterized protein n=1 Tax=Haliotis asinina TaxID=109174 RepID=UPI003531AEEB